ncbi:MAG TPA: hypothetical protein DEA08_36720 [Planctomycetes bacterium]|nr:hypothetical protein [Planctomycetota bacterium]
MEPPWGYTRLPDGSVEGFHEDRRADLARARWQHKFSKVHSSCFFLLVLVGALVSLKPYLLVAVVVVGAFAGASFLAPAPPARWREFALSEESVLRYSGGKTSEERFDPAQLEIERTSLGWSVHHLGRPLGPQRSTRPEAARDRAFVLDHFGCEDPEPKPLRLKDREGALQCTYCRDTIEGPPLRCGTCSAAVHSECAEEQPACTTVGCGGHFLTPLTRVRVES